MLSQVGFKRSTALVGLGIVVAISGALLVVYNPEEVRAGQPQIFGPSAQPERAHPGRERSSLRVPVGSVAQTPGAVPQDSDARKLLMAHYGSDSAAVLAALAERGVDIDSLQPPLAAAEFEAVLPNWLEFDETERDSWREKLDSWPEVLTNDYLKVHFGLTLDLSPEDLAGVDALADLYAPEIILAVDGYLDHLEVAMATELIQGGVRSSPFLAWPPTGSQGDMASSDQDTFFSIVRSGQGWVSQVNLGASAHPETFAARQAIASAISRRNHDLAKSVAYLSPEAHHAE
jgi:hypothetical protein